MVSLGSVVSSIIAVVLLSIYGYFFITHIDRPVYKDMRFLIFLLLIAGIKLMLPFNLPVNIAVPSKLFLVPASDVIYIKLPGIQLKIYEAIIYTSLLIGLALLFIKSLNYYRFVKEIKKFTFQDEKLDTLLSERELNYHPNKITSLYTDTKLSPFVFGLLHPTIVIPKNVYSEGELVQVIDHELTHINQHDLLLKWFFSFLSAIYWWNPFIWMIRKQADNAIELSNDISLYKEMTEEEKTDYAALLVKTADLSSKYETQHSLSLSTHNDPILKQRVNDLLNTPEPKHTLLAVHIIIMLLIVSVSFIITPEPYGIHEDQIDGSFKLEERFDEETEDSYIIDAGDHYDLYVDGAFVCDFYEIPDEFKDYPVYKEKPDGGDDNNNDK